MTEDDEQFQKATKAVDNAMRIDMLGPAVCKVLKEHTPTSEQLKEIIANAIGNDVEVRKALGLFNAEQTITRKGKNVTQAQTILYSVVGTVILTLVATTLYNHFIK